MTGDPDPIRLVSELPEPKQRFLARVVDYALQDGWRSPDDFMGLFPPETLIESLADGDKLRVKILVEATGMHERIALKKSISSAAEDLRLALEEGMTTAATLVEQYPPDDKVRYLDNEKLWNFAVEDEFWKTQASIDKSAHTKAAARLTFMLECALSEGLVTLKDITDGMTFHEIATAMPVMELQEVVKHALQIARADAPLTEERLLAVVPLTSIVEFVSLEHTYERVVVDKIAAPCGFTEALGVPSSRSNQSASKPASEPAAAKPPTPPPPPPTTAAAPPPPPGSSPPAGRESDRPAEEDAARKRVMERLQTIDRLPPRHDELLTPILLSIESMYSDLSALEDDEEREACIRESFPNAMHLRTAMLALIQLLDPSINTEDPVIHDADVDGLIKIVLFEERRRSDNGMGRPKTGSSPASARRSARRSVPPPLPKSGGSSPPPLPEEGARRKQR